MEILLAFVIGFGVGAFVKGTFTLRIEHKYDQPEQVIVEQVKPEEILGVLSPEIGEWYAQLGGEDVRRI